MRSPPDSSPTFFCWSEPLNPKPADVGPPVQLPAADDDVVDAAGDLLVDGLVGVERLPALVDVGQLDGRPDRQRAAVGLLGADDHAEQGGLAGPVGADDADDAARRQREGQVVDQQAVAVALDQVLGLDHHVAQAGTGRDGDLQLLGLARAPASASATSFS